jgi:magnesium-transporting ATPase (P-type)
MDLRDSQSVLTEWILKFGIIFFIASLFFDSFITETLGNIDAIKIGFIVKIIIISIYGILLSVLEKNVFKIVGFASVIIGSVFKILLYISQDHFSIIHITDIADYILIITISIYYLQRHFRKSKKKKKSKH